MQFGKKKFPLDNQIVCAIPFVVEQSFPIISFLNFCLQAKAKRSLKDWIITKLPLRCEIFWLYNCFKQTLTFWPGVYFLVKITNKKRKMTLDGFKPRNLRRFFFHKVVKWSCRQFSFYFLILYFPLSPAYPAKTSSLISALAFLFTASLFSLAHSRCSLFVWLSDSVLFG